MLESFLLAVGGIGVMLAVGALEKWRRAQGRVRASLSEHPAWEAVADELVRALQPLEAEVEAYRDENEDVGVVVLVHGVDPGFVLRMSDGRTGDVEVGHLGFDQQFDVQGSTAMVRARLDGPTRDALLELARRPLRDGQLTVANGQLRAMVPPAQRVGLSDPAGAVPLLAKVARRLSARIDVIAELATNVREDPVAGVRVQCLRTLVRDSPRPASALAPLLGEAAHDPDPEVRLEAATALGVEGEAVLGALVADTAVDDDIAARAAAILGPRIDAGVARATLQHERTVSSARRRPAVARACALALGERGEAQDEALLLAIAADDRDDALRLAAVRALARVGSAQAVPSLAELAGAASADLRRAGREAIATIQSRLQGATPGQLSLHAGGAGQVALADDAAGRLSRASATDER